MSKFSVSREDEIRQVSVGRPHVVVVGAGASLAALPNGDARGRILPVMRNFLEIVPVGPVLESAGLSGTEDDFETMYSKLRSDPELQTHADELEAVIFDYFADLQLPSQPTIYDWLLLSLRAKDVVATFNWDPFLIQAATRNRPLAGRLPTLLFLHGNVLSGFCEKDRVHGVRGRRCSKCGKTFAESRLLFPVVEKDYETDPSIADAWAAFKSALRSAFMLTVFGYGAPASDVAAMTYIRDGWGPGVTRNMEQFEAINTSPEDELRERWRELIHTHHYDIRREFSHSWVANHPRRSGEAWWNQYMDAKFIEPNPFPNDVGFDVLWNWFDPLIEAEGATG